MSNEKIIRNKIKDMIQDKGIIREEYTHWSLNTRNDVMLINDNQIISFEIKSDKDNLNRLYNQVVNYKEYSTDVIIVLDKKHLNKFNHDFNIPEFKDVGVWVYTESNTIEKICNSSSTNYPNLLPYLWSNELAIFKYYLKGKSKIRNNSKDLTLFINNVFTEEEIIFISKKLFMGRFQLLEIEESFTRLDHSSFNCLECIEIIKNKQEIFNQYIKG